jgi:hypothetical protein
MGLDQPDGGGRRALRTSELKLLLNRETFELKVDGICANVDEALSMLQTATRYLESEFHAREQGKTIFSATIGRIIFPKKL